MTFNLQRPLSALQILGTLIFLLNFNSVQGQSTNKLDQQQIWLYFYPHIKLNDKLDFTGDIGYRTFASRQDIFSTYIRPSWSYHSNKRWTFHGGIGFFYTDSEEAILNKFEIRPWQGVQYNGPSLGPLSFKHLIRTEERFSNFPQVDNAYYFEFRLRYKLSGKLSFKNSKTFQNWYVPFYGELFFPVFDELDGFFSNKSRTGVGIGRKGSDWKLQMTYNWHLSRAIPDAELDYSFNSLQIKFFKTWDLRQ